jgi:hypothetical protein
MVGEEEEDEEEEEEEEEKEEEERWRGRSHNSSKAIKQSFCSLTSRYSTSPSLKQSANVLTFSFSCCACSPVNMLTQFFTMMYLYTMSQYLTA